MNHVITRPTKAALRRQAERSIQFDAFVTYEADGDKDPSEWLLPGYQGHHMDNGLPVPLYDELKVLFAKDWGMPEREKITLETVDDCKIVAVPGVPVGCEFGWLVVYEIGVVGK
jgi:hypothetical protein